MVDGQDFDVQLDEPTGQVTVANIKSRMSIEEAEALAAKLTRVVDDRKAVLKPGV